jgi:rod shape-determining protein MreC
VVFLFVALEILSLVLLSNNKGYQRSIMLSSGNIVVGRMYEATNAFVEFFKLSEANDNLAIENTQLKNRVVELENKLNSLTDTLNNVSWKSIRISPENEYAYITAKVIRNTTHLTQNYITLNKGSLEGIAPDMGVIGDDGVVGIVKSVSPKFSVVIPILNPKIQISSKFKKNNYSGPLVWNGKDSRFASLNDIARHVRFSLGDTIVTSGLTKNFPGGILVGTINDYNIKESDAYYNIQVKLAVNYRTLTHVKVINYKNYSEQSALEKQVTDEDKKK